MAGGAGPVLGRYGGLGVGQRLYCRVRWWVCPFDRVLPEVPERGRLLDVGCGAGLWLSYLALERPGLELVGVEPDPRKVAIARAAGGDDFSVVEGSARELPAGPFDCVTVLDVLYLLPDEEKLRTLRGCAELLAPGGTLVIKELDVLPRWKWVLGAVEETVAVRMVGLTQGDRLHFQPVEELRDAMKQVGLEQVRARRVDRGYPHPHVLVTGRRGSG